ncbi:MAG: response regulator [Cyanobacteriota bacterium]|nr:response regulator [Cyanobacteriota bacterium]
MSTVLVVEDSTTELEIISRCLQQAGMAVISAKSGEEAQTKLASQQPDLIVLDVILPGQSGFELCRELRADSKTSGIPIIICSTKGTDVDKMWGDMLGANAYLTKPIDQAELVAAVRRLIK